jgi:hypothetical protein
MTRTGRIGIAAATALFSVACANTPPTAPTRIVTVPSVVGSSATSESAGLKIEQVSCTIDIGETGRPLPALHVLAAWINASLETSSLSCGQVRSLAAKLQQEVASLDQPSQNFDAACGQSAALLREIQTLIETGQLAVLTFPAPVPGAPTTVLGLAEETNEHFCAAAHD